VPAFRRCQITQGVTNLPINPLDLENSARYRTTSGLLLVSFRQGRISCLSPAMLPRPPRRLVASFSCNTPSSSRCEGRIGEITAANQPSREAKVPACRALGRICNNWASRFGRSDLPSLTLLFAKRERIHLVPSSDRRIHLIASMRNARAWPRWQSVRAATKKAAIRLSHFNQVFAIKPSPQKMRIESTDLMTATLSPTACAPEVPTNFRSESSDLASAQDVLSRSAFVRARRKSRKPRR